MTPFITASSTLATKPISSSATTPVSQITNPAFYGYTSLEIVDNTVVCKSSQMSCSISKYSPLPRFQRQLLYAFDLHSLRQLPRPRQLLRRLMRPFHRLPIQHKAHWRRNHTYLVHISSLTHLVLLTMIDSTSTSSCVTDTFYDNLSGATYARYCGVGFGHQWSRELPEGAISGCPTLAFRTTN